MEFDELVKEANKVYLENFPATTTFERAVFFSWYCAIRDCGFCFMSVEPEKYTKKAIRDPASMFAEVLVMKHCGWDFGFFSGGINAYAVNDFLPLLKTIVAIYGKKIWLNVGPIQKSALEKYAPYIEGVVGSIETVNPELHKKVCPSKPIAPYEKMFEDAAALGLKRGMSMIVGMGETQDDFALLKDFIEKYGITKVHLYGLVPQKGTMFENSDPPTEEYQAWWIAQLRVTFPTLDIQCGVWKERDERLPLLLKAGANSFSKLPVMRLFGTDAAKRIEQQVKNGGREFVGSLVELPAVDWKKEVDALPLSAETKDRVWRRLQRYLGKMKGKRGKGKDI